MGALMRYQPQGGPVQVDPLIGADFAWCAPVGKIVGPAVTPTAASGKIVSKAGVGLNSGYAVVAAASIPSIYATTWTECGVLLLDGVSGVTTLSARNVGQAVIITSTNVDLVMWAVADVNIGGTVPVGIVHYVVKRNGSAHTVWFNGKLFGTASSASAPSASDGTLPAIGAQAGNGGSIGGSPLVAATSVLSVVRTPKALSDAKCLALSANHWQIFKSPQQAMAAAGTAPAPTSTATLAATLGTLTGNNTGAAKVSGQAVNVLAGISLAAAATVTANGQAAMTLAGITPAAAGAVDVHALTAGQMGGASLVSTGTVGTGGASAATLGGMTAAGAGAAPVSGALSKTFGPLAVAVSGAVAVQGAAAATLGDLALAASGSTTGAAQTTTAMLAATLAPLTTISAASHGVAGLAAGQLAGCTLAAAGAVSSSAQASAQLGGIALAASGGVRSVAGAQIVLATMTLTAIAGGMNFTRSDRRTFRFPAENRRYVFSRENRRYNFTQ